MRIFSTGDFHGDTRLAEKLAEEAAKEKADLVIICGDITRANEKTENLIGPFLKKGQKVAFIPGNHESFATADFLEELYGTTNLHGKGRMYDNIGIFGCGGANIGIEQLTEEEMYEKLREGFEKIKDAKKKVMVTHVHPSGSSMERLTDFFPGSTGIRKALDSFKPDILFCCHVHEAAGLEEKIGDTKVINVCRLGKIIDL